LERLHRKERVAAILKILSDNPNKIINLGHFSEVFGAARSTLSEDIAIVKMVVESLECGLIETISGAAGGVKYIPGMSKKDEQNLITSLCDKIKSPDRIMPGEFLYINDIIYSPEIINKVGVILASQFKDKLPDCVVTIETKGIPIAMATATALNVPLVIVRRNSKVTEGSTVSINYVTGSSKRIQTMSLSKKSLRKGSRCVFIDDFIKAGGTASGIVELMKEFDSVVVGIGVLIESKTSGKRLVEDFVALMQLEHIDVENEEIKIYPSEAFSHNIT
jgi:purine operon repressor